jgi:type IV pilus assembly protein PilB
MKIGESLLKLGLITSEELNVALDEQKKTHDRLGDIVLKMGFVKAEEMAPFLAQYFNISFVNLKHIYKDIKPEIIDMIPAELAHRFTTVPIEFNNNTLTLAMFDPLDLVARDTIRIRTGHKIQCVVAPEADIVEAIEYCYQHLPRMQKHVEKFIDLELVPKNETVLDSVEEVSFDANDQPVVQYVKDLIVEAVKNGASDIHIQPKDDKVDLRFRVDGVLYNRDSPPKAMLGAITTRVKILAGLDIAERRLPQDGRFKVKIGKSEIDLRTSSFPTIYGESVVMRILDTSSPLLGLEQLGFYPQDLKNFRRLIKQSYGIVLVTGPTGSGKTTTLYTALNEIKSSDKNIITLEDPVEYRLPFIQQSQVNSQIGFDFARGLRSILRQDPDVIMVGEIRDKETAEIAIHAALTGHLVFSTLHTNDAAGAAVRLINMGVEPFLLTSSLLGVVAQRLIRKICPHCREAHSVEKDVLKKLSLDHDISKFYQGKGCDKCFNSGYKGRMGIYELLTIDESVRKHMLARSSSDDIRAAAQKSGMRTLRQIGLEKLKEGLTTPEEVLRVTQETDGDINL